MIVHQTQQDQNETQIEERDRGCKIKSNCYQQNLGITFALSCVDSNFQKVRIIRTTKTTYEI